jgi:hypothetical protein
MAFPDMQGRLDEINRHRQNLPYYDAQGNRTTPPSTPGWGPTGAQAPAPVTATGGLKDSLAGLLPGNWQGFAPALGQSMDLASGLAGQENARHAEALKLLQGEFQRANNASAGMGQQEIDARMGRASDSATGQSLGDWGTLRSQLGQMGVTGGGLAAGLGAQLELGRLGQIQGSKRDIAIAEMERQSSEASNRYLRSMGLANFMNESPSMLELDQFNSLIDTGLNAQLGERGVEASKYSARQQKKGAKAGALGSAIGGL